MANDPLRLNNRRPSWTNTTPPPAAPRLIPTSAEPTRRFERAIAFAVFILAAALVARGFC